MATQRGRTSQTAGMYRKIDKDAMPDDFTYLNDERFDAITERVIAYMDATAVQEWTRDQWQLFRTLWADRKSKRRLTEQEVTKAMTTAQLEELMSSDAASDC